VAIVLLRIARMRHLSPVAIVFLAGVSLAPVLGAQQSTTARSRNRASDKPRAVVLRGCVAEASGHYLLTKAVVTNAPARPTPGAAAPTGASSDDQTYELIGPAVKAQVGHQVEVSGSPMVSETAAGGVEPNDLKRTAHPMAGTINVKAMKKLSGTCP
jgi:hypothetical protein